MTFGGDAEKMTNLCVFPQITSSPVAAESWTYCQTGITWDRNNTALVCCKDSFIRSMLLSTTMLEHPESAPNLFAQPNGRMRWQIRRTFCAQKWAHSDLAHRQEQALEPALRAWSRRWTTSIVK